MRPRIAITTWRRDLPTFLGERTRLYTLGDEYVRSVHDAGGLPLLVPHLSADEVDAVLDVADGLLVAGGGDVHPASYGAADDGSYGTDPGADASELALLAGARRRGLPTLAVCRGMQLVNVAAGGTLQQDVTGLADHPPIADDPDEVLVARHPVDVVPGTRLAEVLGPGAREVNTIHHQAIDRLGDGLQVAATSTDGLIEAIEWGGWALLAVQWHPEKLRETEAPLFSWLVGQARAGAEPASTAGEAATPLIAGADAGHRLPSQ